MSDALLFVLVVAVVLFALGVDLRGAGRIFKPLNVAGKAPTSVGIDQTSAAARSARRPSS